MKPTVYVLSFLLLCFVISCKKEAVNQPPTANAGTDITAQRGQKVSLNGSLSKDPENANLVYSWSFKSKPATSQATIQNANMANAEFTPDQAGTYVLTLRVTDDQNQSASADVTVMVSLPGRAPAAVAPASISTTYGNKVVLDGSSSSDPDGDKLTYKWSFKTRPSGSSTTLPITNDAQAKAEFEPDATGTYVLTLTVSDGIWPEVTTDVTVIVNESPTVTVCPDNGRLTASTTWKNLVQDPTKPDYIICKDIVVYDLLTVEPGVVVAFKQNTGISIGGDGRGAIVAKGTVEKPIVFTGEQQVAGSWNGMMIHNSNDARNALDYVTVSYGGGNVDRFYGELANLNVSGRAGPTSVKLTNCSFTNSKGRGVYVGNSGPGGVLTGFSNNKFSANTLYPIQLPASQVEKLDENSTFASSNGINVVAIYGGLNATKETTWGPFKDGTRYRFTESFHTGSGLVIKPGTIFEVASQKAIGIDGDGYLIAKGTADKRIVFTGEVKAPGSWGGILFDRSVDVRNELSYAEVSYGGGDPAYMYAAKGNVILWSGFGGRGRVKITNSIISNSSDVGIGLYARYGGVLILDNPDSNTYQNNAQGDIAK
ncbi:PKD domain-containing protein [uncultured Spirosoma sp.]|uniref:PKD domain-containing protein n=1 Tax=uncultured Spirosoma sp. TaxID=278208 RepID=UPI0025835664|nr:PKD domain-containing protein [uncultured Spirosoma sp.]